MGWLDILLPIALGIGGSRETLDAVGAWRTPRTVLAGDGYHCLAEDVVVLMEAGSEPEAGLNGEYWAQVRCSYLGTVLYQERRTGSLQGRLLPDGTLEFTIEGGPAYRGRILGHSLRAEGEWSINGVHLRGRIEAIRPAEYLDAPPGRRASAGVGTSPPPG